MIKKCGMITLCDKAITILDLLGCVVLLSDSKCFKIGYNIKTFLRDFKNINIKSIININANIPNEFGSVLDITCLISCVNNLDAIDIRGKTKGKGFAGVIKRYGFAGLRASHGVSLSHRSGGSIGARQDPGKVWKGKKMAGRMGSNYVTIKNIKILSINLFTYRILIYGPIPGGTISALLLSVRKKLV